MVDGSVVVVENVFAKLSHARTASHGHPERVSKLQVVLNAVQEVATPTLVGVTIIILVFLLPPMTLEGKGGKDVRLKLAYTIAIALAISLVLSLTLVACAFLGHFL